MSEVILRVEHLKKYFPLNANAFGKPQRYLKAVDDVSFTLERGKTVGIVGESGCGKPTMGRTILRLHPAKPGTIDFCGRDIARMKASELRKLRPERQIIVQEL